MKVILRSDVAALGRAGDIKEVALGFGRNYLIPKRLALPATAEALRWWEKGKERREKLAEKKLTGAREMAGKISGVSLSFSRPAGAEGKLFGSVGKSDIIKSLKTCGYDVAKEAVILESAIKTVGEHELELKLAPEVSAKIKVSIVPRQ